MKIPISRKTAIRLAAVAVGLQSIVIIRMLFSLDNATETLFKQGSFLADIVERNLDNLSEFDLIALRELGVLKD